MNFSHTLLESADPLEDQEDQRALRILLVEDFPDNRMLVHSYLKKTSYRIDVAENGEIGVGKLKSGQYELVRWYPKTRQLAKRESSS